MAKINLLDLNSNFQFEKELEKNLRGKLRNVKKAFDVISKDMTNSLKSKWPRSGKSPASADNFDYKLKLSYLNGFVSSTIFNKTMGSKIHFIETGTIYVRPQRIIRNLWDKNQSKYDRKIKSALEK